MALLITRDSIGTQNLRDLLKELLIDARTAKEVTSPPDSASLKKNYLGFLDQYRLYCESAELVYNLHDSSDSEHQRLVENARDSILNDILPKLKDSIRILGDATSANLIAVSDKIKDDLEGKFQKKSETEESIRGTSLEKTDVRSRTRTHDNILLRSQTAISDAIDNLVQQQKTPDNAIANIAQEISTLETNKAYLMYAHAVRAHDGILRAANEIKRLDVQTKSEPGDGGTQILPPNVAVNGHAAVDVDLQNINPVIDRNSWHMRSVRTPDGVLLGKPIPWWRNLMSGNISSALRKDDYESRHDEMYFIRPNPFRTIISIWTLRGSGQNNARAQIAAEITNNGIERFLAQSGYYKINKDNPSQLILDYATLSDRTRQKGAGNINEQLRDLGNNLVARVNNGDHLYKTTPYILAMSALGLFGGLGFIGISGMASGAILGAATGWVTALPYTYLKGHFTDPSNSDTKPKKNGPIKRSFKLLGLMTIASFLDQGIKNFLPNYKKTAISAADTFISNTTSYFSAGILDRPKKLEFANPISGKIGWNPLTGISFGGKETGTMPEKVKTSGPQGLVDGKNQADPESNIKVDKSKTTASATKQGFDDSKSAKPENDKEDTKKKGSQGFDDSSKSKDSEQGNEKGVEDTKKKGSQGFDSLDNNKKTQDEGKKAKQGFGHNHSKDSWENRIASGASTNPETPRRERKSVGEATQKLSQLPNGSAKQLG